MENSEKEKILKALDRKIQNDAAKASDMAKCIIPSLQRIRDSIKDPPPTWDEKIEAWLKKKLLKILEKMKKPRM